MKQIAIYGKGGIGKSTITANLSAALAHQGYKVLQIGCDPKHDSTKLLLGGISQVTVLELLKTKSSHQLNASDIVLHGYKGVACIEAGGPEPGIGCAGRGIIAMANTLDDIGFDITAYDVVIYDVLGDVVCGGFAVPMRDSYADEVYIVSSGEIMALYAANNIAKGLSKFGSKLGGIIFNARNVPHERELIYALAEKINTKVIAEFPRDTRFRDAELQQSPVIKTFPDSDLADKFSVLGRSIMEDGTVVMPKPLDSSDFETLIYEVTGIADLNKKIGPQKAHQDKCLASEEKNFEAYFVEKTQQPLLKPKTQKKEAFLSKAKHTRDPYHCCTLGGAFNVTNHLQDTVTIMHSTANCGYFPIFNNYLTAIGAIRRGLLPSKSNAIPNMHCTNLNESDLVYGAEDKLKAKVEEVITAENPKAVFIISSCPSAIIGDDINKVSETFKNSSIPVIPIKSDGIMGGDYSQGVINAYEVLAKEVIAKFHPEVSPKTLINTVGEETIVNNAEEQFEGFRDLLQEMGIDVNCRFVRNSSYESLTNFQKAKYSVRLSNNYLAQTAEKILSKWTKTTFLGEGPPVGFSATLQFLEDLSIKTGKPMPEKAIEKAKQERRNFIERYKPILQGKKAIIGIYTSNISWVKELADEFGISLELIAVCNSCMNTDIGINDVPIVEIKNNDDLMALVEKHSPALLLQNYPSREAPLSLSVAPIPLCPPIGLNGTLKIAEIWAKTILTKPGKWRLDNHKEEVKG